MNLKDRYAIVDVGLERKNIEGLIRDHFELKPAGIMKSLDLRKPRFKQTAAYGHFGRKEKSFTWEQTDKAAKLKKSAGL